MPHFANNNPVAPPRPTTGALCQRFPNEPAASRAQRRPDHQFLALRNRPHHQQAREIRARNQQHQAYGSEEHQQCRPHVSYQPFMQRN